MLAGVLIFVALVLQAQTPIAPKTPFTAKDVEVGLRLQARSAELQKTTVGKGPAEPFKILGNLYFVGIGLGQVYLLTSPQGHILLGAGYADTTDIVEKNIAAMGFKLSDIKVIAPTHAHGDQAGGAAYFKQKTGAELALGFGDIPALEKGEGDLAPVKVDRALHDGDVIKVGPLTVNVHAIPGHTPGSVTFTFNVREGNRDYRVLDYCCMQNVPNNIATDPNYSDAVLKRNFEKFRTLLPVDVYITGPSYGWLMTDRLAKLKAGDRMAFVDRSLFPGLVAALEVQVAEKKAGR
jgi:metallo-beta-lactamase class B